MVYQGPGYNTTWRKQGGKRSYPKTAYPNYQEWYYPEFYSPEFYPCAAVPGATTAGIPGTIPGATTAAGVGMPQTPGAFDGNPLTRGSIAGSDVLGNPLCEESASIASGATGGIGAGGLPIGAGGLPLGAGPIGGLGLPGTLPSPGLLAGDRRPLPSSVDGQMIVLESLRTMIPGMIANLQKSQNPAPVNAEQLGSLRQVLTTYSTPDDVVAGVIDNREDLQSCLTVIFDVCRAVARSGGPQHRTPGTLPGIDKSTSINHAGLPSSPLNKDGETSAVDSAAALSDSAGGTTTSAGDDNASKSSSKETVGGTTGGTTASSTACSDSELDHTEQRLSRVITDEPTLNSIVLGNTVVNPAPHPPMVPDFSPPAVPTPPDLPSSTPGTNFGSLTVTNSTGLLATTTSTMSGISGSGIASNGMSGIANNGISSGVPPPTVISPVKSFLVPGTTLVPSFGPPPKRRIPPPPSVQPPPPPKQEEETPPEFLLDDDLNLAASLENANITTWASIAAKKKD